MSDDVPEAVRLLVGARERFRCGLCGGRGTDWHHRRRRGVLDEFTHTAVNGVLLCRKDHSWIHANPLMARGVGHIVSAYVDNPGLVPIYLWQRGWVLLTDEGEYVDAPEIPEQEGSVLQFRRPGC